MNKKILVVDDDNTQRTLLDNFLSSKDFSCTSATNGRKAIDAIKKSDFAMVVMDVQMPEMSGLEALREIREQHPHLPVLLITAYADVRDAVTAIKDGALDYLSKPVDLKELLAAVEDTIGITTKNSDEKIDLPKDVVARSSSFLSILQELKIVAPSTASILITGESGTGKEILANLTHQWSERQGQALVKVNCAAIPENLMESELFGHEKGAFTGASQQREGYFHEANGGTLFLDEIGEMPINLQAKLLRVLQDGTYQRLGSSKTCQSDVRLIAATNQNIEETIAAGQFREDLFYRLSVIHLTLPSLRERRPDILPLAQHFVRQFSQNKVRFSHPTETILESYDWPGNVRELRNVIERACLLSRGEIIFPEQLPKKIRGENKPTVSSAPGGNSMEDVERDTILQTLIEMKGNRTQAAKKLGISRRGLLYKLQKYKEEGYGVD